MAAIQRKAVVRIQMMENCQRLIYRIRRLNISSRRYFITDMIILCTVEFSDHHFAIAISVIRCSLFFDESAVSCHCGSSAIDLAKMYVCDTRSTVWLPRTR